MKTLEQHNKEITDRHVQENTFPRKNGIECPKCYGELSDADRLVLLSYPSQRNIICENPECGYKGYRYQPTI